MRRFNSMSCYNLNWTSFSISEVIPYFQWGPLAELRGHFQFHCRCESDDSHVGPVVVVSPELLRGLILGLLYYLKDILIQPFVVYRRIVAVDMRILLRLAWLNY